MQEDLAKERQVEIDPVAVAERESGREEGSFDALLVADADRGPVAKGTGSPFRAVHLRSQRVPDDSGHQMLRLARRDRDGPEGKSGNKVGGAVERVDDPGPLRVLSSGCASFLAQKRIIGKVLTDSLDDRSLAVAI